MSDEGIVKDETERERLETELIERREVALAKVIKFGDPVLKSRASPVVEFGPELRAEVDRMIAIMRDGMGVGLAATQAGLFHHHRRKALMPQSRVEPETGNARAYNQDVSGNSR